MLLFCNWAVFRLRAWQLLQLHGKCVRRHLQAVRPAWWIAPYIDTSGFPICASGSSCQFNGCLCVPYLGEGQPCGAGDCGDGLYCDLGTTGTCQERKTSGTCTYGYECAAGYVCTGSAYAKTCTKVKLPGDSCTQGQSECYGLSFCSDNGKCTRTGVVE